MGAQRERVLLTSALICFVALACARPDLHRRMFMETTPSGMPSWGSRGRRFKPNGPIHRTPLVLYPQLVEQDAKRRCPLIVADPFGHQVDAERVDQRDPRRLLHDLPVDALPGAVGRGSVGGLQCGCAGDLAVNLPVAEAGRVSCCRAGGVGMTRS